MGIEFEPLTLTTENILLIASLFLVVIGWIVTVWHNRRFEIFKRRMDKRMIAFESVLPILRYINDTGKVDHPDMKKMIEEARALLQLYADKDQVEVYEKFIKCIEKNDLDGANLSLKALNKVIPSAIRKDLGLRPL